jgi:hypothetical protein
LLIMTGTNAAVAPVVNSSGSTKNNKSNLRELLNPHDLDFIAPPFWHFLGE